MFENIDFTVIQLQQTPKSARIFQCTKHIVEEESPKALNHKLNDVEEYHLLIEPLSQINYVYLKSNGGTTRNRAFCDELFCNGPKSVTKGVYLSHVLVPSQLILFVAARYVPVKNS